MRGDEASLDAIIAAMSSRWLARGYTDPIDPRFGASHSTGAEAWPIASDNPRKASRHAQ